MHQSVCSVTIKAQCCTKAIDKIEKSSQIGRRGLKLMLPQAATRSFPKLDIMTTNRCIMTTNKPDPFLLRHGAIEGRCNAYRHISGHAPRADGLCKRYPVKGHRRCNRHKGGNVAKATASRSPEAIRKSFTDMWERRRSR